MLKQELLPEFKKLTEYKWSDVAERFGVSRQHISAELRNHSLTHMAAVAFYLNKMIDEKIMELKIRINNLEQLKSNITRDVMKGVDGRDHNRKEPS